MSDLPVAAWPADERLEVAVREETFRWELRRLELRHARGLVRSAAVQPPGWTSPDR